MGGPPGTDKIGGVEKPPFVYKEKSAYQNVRFYSGFKHPFI